MKGSKCDEKTPRRHRIKERWAIGLAIEREGGKIDIDGLARHQRKRMGQKGGEGIKAAQSNATLLHPPLMRL